jgi:hypothetical protein
VISRTAVADGIEKTSSPLSHCRSSEALDERHRLVSRVAHTQLDSEPSHCVLGAAACFPEAVRAVRGEIAGARRSKPVVGSEGAQYDERQQHSEALA